MQPWIITRALSWISENSVIIVEEREARESWKVNAVRRDGELIWEVVLSAIKTCNNKL